jgi:GntR family transcriptional regulator, transcriptional repressor for pyruvate dehydrogenase complex
MGQTTAVKRSLVSDQVFRILSGQILAGDYGPGEKLPTQRALAADLGVNMASVREAVKRLEQMELVEVRHGDAMRVRDWRSHGGLDVLGHLLIGAGRADRTTLAAVLEARRLMLAEAARLAAARRSDAQARRLVELAGGLAEAGDPDTARALDLAFMSELVEAADNVVFVLILNTVRRLWAEHVELFAGVVGDPRKLAGLYARAATAVAAAKGEAAAAAVAELAGEQERRMG